MPGPLDGWTGMPPQAWSVPPQHRVFPDFLQEAYENPDTRLAIVFDLWMWRHDLASLSSPFQQEPAPDEKRITQQLCAEVEHFLMIEEESREAIRKAERELSQARMRRIIREHQDSAES